ncbi:MAG: MarR family transcriptional regulator [Candidatus Hodarchaeota archaeon]
MDETEKVVSMLEKLMNKIENIESRLLSLEKKVDTKSSPAGNQRSGYLDFEKTHLTSQQQLLLLEMEKLKGERGEALISVYELVRRLGKKRPYIATYLGKLHNWGYVEREPNIPGRKVLNEKGEEVIPRWLYTLTEKGKGKATDLQQTFGDT